MKVEIISRESIFKGFFTLEKATVRFELFNNTMSPAVGRLNVYRGDAVSVLLYNSQKQTLVFVRQFRYPVYTAEPDNAWTIECVAGAIEEGLADWETAIQEVQEETGYRLNETQLEYIGKCYPSPGGTSERIYLFAADIADSERRTRGGGRSHDDAEDIRMEEYSFTETFRMVESLEICDAKTLLSLTWFKNRLRGER
jgi:nudix-type nucleoside diphosphatase (YffH/AdpP family)